MKKILSLVAIAAIALTTFAQESQLEQLDRLKAEAKKDGKLVMVKFLTVQSLGAPTTYQNDWLMHKNVFLNANISSLIEDKYLAMQVTKFQVAGKPSPIRVTLKVTAVPSVVILNAEGEEVHRLTGFNMRLLTAGKRYNEKELMAKLNELSEDNAKENAKEKDESKVEDKKAK